MRCLRREVPRTDRSASAVARAGVHSSPVALSPSRVPEDYLKAFAEFVHRESDKVDALAVLLARPKDWNPDALVALRDALKSAPEHFIEANLERAHLATYQKALVDIISMVKHAAADIAPLLTARERVEAAMTHVGESRDRSQRVRDARRGSTETIASADVDRSRCSGGGPNAVRRYGRAPTCTAVPSDSNNPSTEKYRSPVS